MHSSVNYLLAWATYRKHSRLPYSDSILTHKPNNAQELSFHLQIASLLVLANQISQIQPTLTSQTQLLLQDLKVNNLTLMLTPEYLNSLFLLSQQCFKGQQSRKKRVSNVLLSVVSLLTPWRQLEKSHEDLTFLNLVGEICGVLERSGKSDFIQFFKDWWSFKEWGRQYISDSLLELLLIWCSKGDYSSDSLLELLDLFVRWFNQVQALLSQAKTINCEVVCALTAETKQMVKLCQMRGKKATKQLLFSLKSSLLASKNLKPEVFASLFSLLDTSASESQLVLFDGFDLLSNEYFYRIFYYLQTTDSLKEFTAFHTFMNNHSVCGVLKITASLTTEMQGCQFSSEPDLDQMIRKKQLSILNHFQLNPLTISIKILTHYQHLSGIFISQPKKANKQRAVSKTFKPEIPDPLQFMLIHKQFWQEKFGYEVLGLSLWLICDAYCKEIQIKSKDMPIKQVNEYTKKLKTGICIFLLGLRYPVKMLQFLPLEDDLAWQLSVVPIVPGLLLDCGYFFKEFQRDNLSFRERQNFGAEGDVLPWASSLTAHKHIPFVLHNHRGYEFFQAVLGVSNQSNFKIYAQIILFSLASVLKKMGIATDSSQNQRKQVLSQLPSETKEQIMRLLSTLSAAGDKIGETSNGLISLLS